jgi:hypothetical protein
VPSQHTGKKISDEQRSLGKENKILKGNKKIVLDPRGIVGRQFCIFWKHGEDEISHALGPQDFWHHAKDPIQSRRLASMIPKMGNCWLYL